MALETVTPSDAEAGIAADMRELADNNLVKARSILGILQYRGPTISGDRDDRSNAIWAAMDLIEEARVHNGKH